MESTEGDYEQCLVTQGRLLGIEKKGLDTLVAYESAHNPAGMFSTLKSYN
jgi:hypothetical protein